MKRGELTRRDFNRLTAAAMGGLVAGTIAGCGGDEKPDGAGTGSTPAGGHGGPGPASHEAEDAGAAGAETHDVSLLLEEPHVCRGLNTCMNKGTSGENACAGQGACHTAVAHACHAQNECKGQGGCGDYPGQNTCREKGECGVPLSESAWQNARAAFEKIWKERNPDKTLGQPPEA